MNLRDKYSRAIQAAKGKFHGDAQEREGKLHFKGTVGSEAEKNEIWSAIKTVPDWQKDIVADIQVTGSPSAAAAPRAAAAPESAGRTYTVKAGDTLSKIAKEQLGDANAYPEIFNANRDQLTDPDKITPGQVLKIPALSK
jgi:nucleoid-associated protein YgaU